MSDDWIPIGYLNVELHEIGDNSSGSSGQMFNLLQQPCQPEEPRFPPPSPPEESENRPSYTRRWLWAHDSYFQNEEPYAEDEPCPQTAYSPQATQSAPHHHSPHPHPEPRFHPYARPEDMRNVPRFHHYQQNVMQETIDLEFPDYPEDSPLPSSMCMSPDLSPQRHLLSPQPGRSSPHSGHVSPQLGPLSPKRRHLGQLIPPPSEAAHRSPQPIQLEPVAGPSHMYVMPMEEYQTGESGPEPQQRGINTLGATPFYVPQALSPQAAVRSSPVFGTPHRSPREMIATQMFVPPPRASGPPRILEIEAQPVESAEMIEQGPADQGAPIEVQLVESAEMIEQGPAEQGEPIEAQPGVSAEMIEQGPVDQGEPMEMSCQGSAEDIQAPRGDSPIPYVPPAKKPRMSEADMPAGEDDDSDDDL